jgi:lipoprotein-releasing system ATP-binding protein
MNHDLTHPARPARDGVCLHVQQLTKQFHLGPDTEENAAVEVLKQVEFTVMAGEMVALLGVSGSGKSTLVQIIGTLDHPTAGHVWLNGMDVFTLSQPQRAAFRNRHIGFVYQSHRLLPEFSALENVMMPLLIRRMPVVRAREQAADALASVGLEARRHHRPGQMSGGEQQRVAIARAIVTDPDLLLADEPTGNLDGHATWKIFDLLRHLNQTRRLTCVMVTHNQELADRLDRRLHLVDGALVEDSGRQIP